MCMCMCKRVLLYVCICMCVYINACMRIYLQIRTHVCIYVYMYVYMYVCMCTCVNMCVCVYVCMMAQFHWESAWGRGPGLGNSIGDLLGEGGPGLANSIGNLLGDLPWSGQFHAEFAWVGLDWAVPLGISWTVALACPTPLWGIDLGLGSSIWKSLWRVALEQPVPTGICLGTTLGVCNSVGNLLGEGPWSGHFHWESLWGDSQWKCPFQGHAPRGFPIELAPPTLQPKQIPNGTGRSNATRQAHSCSGTGPSSATWNLPFQAHSPKRSPIKLPTPALPSPSRFHNGAGHSKATPQPDSQWNCPTEGHSQTKFQMELHSPGPPSPRTFQMAVAIPRDSPSRFPMDMPSPGPLPKQTPHGIDHSIPKRDSQWNWPLQGHSPSRLLNKNAQSRATLPKQIPNGIA